MTPSSDTQLGPGAARNELPAQTCLSPLLVPPGALGTASNWEQISPDVLEGQQGHLSPLSPLSLLLPGEPGGSLGQGCGHGHGAMLPGAILM